MDCWYADIGKEAPLDGSESDSASFLGIYTADPKITGPLIPRPRNPAFPKMEPIATGKDCFDEHVKCGGYTDEPISSTSEPSSPAAARYADHPPGMQIVAYD